MEEERAGWLRLTLLGKGVSAGAELSHGAVFPAGEDHGDLEPPAEGLIEEKTGLELGDEGEPRQDGDRGEDDEPHHVLVRPGELLDRLPEAHLPQQWPADLPDLPSVAAGNLSSVSRILRA